MDKKILIPVLACMAVFAFAQCKEAPRLPGERWSVEKAELWYAEQGWITGCNYVPSTAVNQLEMWQVHTFDPPTIDCELGWAQELGFNTMRVFLHSMAWQQDPQGFKDRVEEYLKISDKHGIKTMFVFFDDCWQPEPSPGKQPEPVPGEHNSRWVHDPAVSLRADTVSLYAALEPYMKDVMETFRDDKRVLMWDLYNEPGNTKQGFASFPLLQKAFQWAREINPSQPLTAGVWNRSFVRLNKFQNENSDIVTFHSYLDPEGQKNDIEKLKAYGRPMISTEWMARTHNCLFENVMPLYKEENVGALNWGFVQGKTNTIFSWKEPRPDGSEPEVWFHDILRTDGTPYMQSEVEVIRTLNGKK